MKIVEYFSRQSRLSLMLTAFALLFALGWVDYVTGPDLALSIFYLVPVFLVTWFVGRTAGVLMSFLGAATWLGAELLYEKTYSHTFIPYWNAAVRLGIFIVSSSLTAEIVERKKIERALRTAQEELEIRVQERTAELARANQSLQTEVAERTQAQEKLKLLNETLEQRVAERSAAAEERALQLALSESALRHQKSILQSILNSMGSGVIVANAQGKILLFNPAAERLLRIELADVTSADLLQQQETYLPDMLTAYPTSEHPLLRTIRGEKIDGAEMFVRHVHAPDGFWLRATGRPLLDEKGKVQGGVLVFNDVTLHKLLEKQIAEISDREQRRIGQDLHDGLCQHLVSTAFAAEVLRQKLSQKQVAESAQAETISELVNEAITQARQLARGLYPVRLEVDGLASALEELAVSTQARTNVVCRFACDEPVFIYDQIAASNLYRIAQEALNNSIKHGRVKNISIGLGAVEDEVTLMVKDDGIGFPETLHQNGGMGLHIMNYRARMIGAALDIRRGVGGGTIVICSFHNENLLENSNGYATKK